MAFEKRLRDTSPKTPQIAYSGGSGGVPPISPLTSVIQTSSSRPRFSTGGTDPVIPATQDPPGPGITLSGGRRGQGSTGSGLGDSIQGLANKFAKAIRDRPTVMSKQEAAIAYGGGEYGPSPTSTAPSYSADVTPTPIPSGQFNINPAFTATNLKEGGFIRKKT